MLSVTLPGAVLIMLGFSEDRFSACRSGDQGAKNRKVIPGQIQKDMLSTDLACVQLSVSAENT